MFTAGGGPGEVHSYFSPYESPMDAFVAAQTLLNDFELRLRLSISAANEPFLFYTGIGKECYTGSMVWSLKGFVKALEKVDIKAVEFHFGNGDFESWIRCSLKDEELAARISSLKDYRCNNEELRKKLVGAANKRFDTLTKKVKESTKLF